MPRFCHFWQMTPTEFYALKPAEYRAMLAYMRDYERDLKRQGAGK